jgi:hypothetical protein
VRIRLIKKLAEMIDGIDLTGRNAGDLLDLTKLEARILLAEGWAVREPGRGNPRQYVSRTPHPSTRLPALAADRPSPTNVAKPELDDTE